MARELHAARVDRGLSLRVVGAACGISASEASRIERGIVSASIIRLAQLAAVVGLDLSVRLYPGGSPVRDSAQLAILARFRAHLHQTWQWATEVPLPTRGDQRAWDALIALGTCRYGVEVETAPTDGQALVRRLQLKQRDGSVDGVLLVLPRTARVREFVATAAPSIESFFPIAGGRALELLGAGVDPGGNALILMPRA